ncbi:MAG: AarF/ABC1/UbiB kinase family protein [Caldilineales bacterium]|nr:AarF/ABC1/UbiB kinase family protein [Caldilineales bacterium]
MRRSSVDKIRENLRLQQVYNVFLRYAWDLAFENWSTLSAARHAVQAWVWNLPPELADMSTPVKVRLMLEELGPTYVKMGQIVSSQASVIPVEWQVELDKLQSSVPPFPASQVREVLIEELGAPPEELFASFEPQPFAAASTAQVHRAVLHNGDTVAVKVQRPNIKVQMKADLGIMQNAARVATRRSDYIKAIDLDGMLEQFSQSALAELDYTGEAYNAYRLRENMSQIPDIHIPTIYSNLSTTKILTMEFIRGVKITNLEAIEAAGLDRARLANAALRAVSKQLFIDGFFHADPHPGNLLVSLDTGQITFIDTGMVGELTINQRLNLVQLLLAVQKVDVKGMAQVMRSLSVPYVSEVDESAFYRDFERSIGRIMYGGTAVSMGEAVSVSLELLRVHGLRLDPQLTLAIKAMMQAEAISSRLYPEGGLVAEGTQMVRQMLVQEVTADKIINIASDQLMMAAREVFRRLPSFQNATIKWLDQYQKGRFEVYVDTSSLAKEVTKLGKLGRMITIALILVGMIIGSAIATGVIAFTGAQNETWTFIMRLAYLGYIFAMIIAIIMVVRLVWQWLRGTDP